MEFNGLFVNAMTKLYNKSFFEGYDQLPTVYDKVFDMVDVDAEYGGRNYGTSTEIIGEGEPEQIGYGEDHKDSLISEGYASTWALRLFQRGFTVFQSDLDNWGSNERLAENYVMTRAKNMGIAFQRRRDRFGAQVFNRGSIAAGDTNIFNGSQPGFQTDPHPGFIYDGKALFAVTGGGAHPLYLDSSATFYNCVASLAISTTNLQTAMNLMQVTNARDSRNLPIAVSARRIIYSPSLDFSVRTILNSTQVAGTANNDANVLHGMLEPIPWHYLTNTSGWYLQAEQKGLRFLHRGLPKSASEMIKFKGTGALKLSMTDEFGFEVTQWRNLFAANVATS